MLIRQLEYSGDLRDSPSLARVLAEAGISRDACPARAALFAQAAAALHLPEPGAGQGPVAEGIRPMACFVPGRIEILGKHTDYAGGSSMVAAAERGFSLVAVATNDCRVTVTDALRPESVTFDFDADIIPRAGHWANYPMTVARRIARNFAGPLRGANMAFASDLPPAAGMSSSSALVVGVFLALAEVNLLAPRAEYRQNIRSLIDLAGYLATIENGQSFGTLKGDQGVGTFGGSEDHTAILTCRPGQISQYAYCPVRFEGELALPPDYTFAIGVSGVVAEKTGAAMAKYNAASQRARRLVQLWRETTHYDDPHLAAVLPRGPAAIEYFRSIVRDKAGQEAPSLLARLEHFITENLYILPAAREALEEGDLIGFGDLVDQSQRAAEDLLGNQVPETSYLADSARSLGAAAASAFGAGFGGGVWAMVESRASAEFLDSWAASYHGRFPEHTASSSFFLTAAGPAALRIRQ
jgi:galactokinase